MKKALTFCFILILLSFAASAQQRFGNNRVKAAITAAERIQLQREFIRYRLVQRNVERDCIITPLERKRLNHIKRKTRKGSIRLH